MFSNIGKLGIIRLGMSPKENFLAYLTQFIFLIIRLVPGNVIIVAIDMCGKSSIMGEWMYGIRLKLALVFTFLLSLFVFLFIFLCV